MAAGEKGDESEGPYYWLIITHKYYFAYGLSFLKKKMIYNKPPFVHRPVCLSLGLGNGRSYKALSKFHKTTTPLLRVIASDM
jgi:hypothetical protein